MVIASLHFGQSTRNTERKVRGLGVVDALFLGMIATSIAGLAYIFLISAPLRPADPQLWVLSEKTSTEPR
jgi:hypothetical protein